METSFVRETNTQGKPFRPSYEGWKHGSTDIGPQGYRPFRPSYEGWKLTKEKARGIAEDTFRPSYEGWKQGMEAGRCRGPGGLLDLPMRDGNMLSLPASANFHYLLDLPMRDGNSYIEFRGLSRKITFRPSYEGWKPGITMDQVAEEVHF